MSAINISFNGYSFQDATFSTRKISHLANPNRLIAVHKMTRADGSRIVDAEFASKVITVEGQLTAENQQALEDKIDEFKRELRGIGQNLDIDYNGTTRRYTATVDDLNVDRQQQHINTVPYTVSFLCVDPFGRATSSGIVNILGVQQALKSILLTVSGSYNPKPAIIITVNSGNNFNLFKLKNDRFNQEIIISPTLDSFIGGDEIVINTEDMTVKLNSSGLDYTGVFPDFDVEDNNLQLTAEADHSDYDAKIQYVNKFL